jgi:arylsulfatase A-like enzyme
MKYTLFTPLLAWQLSQITLSSADQSQQPLLQSPQHTTTKPNIIFILTDDQDLHLQSLDYLPLIKKHLIDQGTLYTHHYCTTALCCPSRVSLWTGKQAHNTNVHPPPR